MNAATDGNAGKNLVKSQISRLLKAWLTCGRFQNHSPFGPFNNIFLDHGKVISSKYRAEAYAPLISEFMYDVSVVLFLESNTGDMNQNGYIVRMPTQ